MMRAQKLDLPDSWYKENLSDLIQDVPLLRAKLKWNAMFKTKSCITQSAIRARAKVETSFAFVRISLLNARNVAIDISNRMTAR